jgi:hypothetical protein
VKKIIRENEFDRISFEILNKIYPTEALNSYFLLGAAQTLHAFTDIANRYINGGYGDKLDATDLKKLIGEYMSGNKEVKEMYDRLRKEGVKTDFEKFQDSL